MQNYQNMPAYLPYQPPVMPQPYQDRLAQLQNQYQNTIPAQSMNSLPNSMPQNNQGILWVQGEAGAKSWLISPNTTLLLMDSENPFFYLKSADSSGVPLPLRVFEYKEINQNNQLIQKPIHNSPQDSYSNENDDSSKYVTRQEFDGLKRQYEEILEQLKSQKSYVPEDIVRPSKSKSKGGITDEQSDI